MPETPPTPPAAGIVVTTDFIRHRNTLLTRARVTDLLLEYYLHLADAGRQVATPHDALFKEMLVAFVLAAASRPRTEYLAWTVNLQEPLLNLFVTGDNEQGTVVGRVFTEDVKRGAANLLYVETVRTHGAKSDPKRRSVIDFHGASILRAAEAYFEKSDQRPGRFFDLGDEEYALLSAHPDFDEAWLRGLDAATLRDSLGTETVVPIERRPCRWHCGCNEQRIFAILAPAMRQNPEDLFRGEDALRLECPRCGRWYRVSREALEAFVAREKP